MIFHKSTLSNFFLWARK